MTDTTTPDRHAPDVVDALTQDHHEALDLLGRIGATTDAAERRDLADTVIAEVVRHSVAEEMYVYPAMSSHLSDGADTVAHDKDEHEGLERIMKDLEGVGGDDPRFDDLVTAMSDALRHHASDEEAEQFEAAGRARRGDAGRAAPQGRDGQEARADAATPRRAERRALPQARRARRRAGRPAPRPAERPFDRLMSATAAGDASRPRAAPRRRRAAAARRQLLCEDPMTSQPPRSPDGETFSALGLRVEVIRPSTRLTVLRCVGRST
ncbi:hemerythrin domain-containing protein [Pseudonocardia benzenivorans]